MGRAHVFQKGPSFLPFAVHVEAPGSVPDAEPWKALGASTRPELFDILNYPI